MIKKPGSNGNSPKERLIQKKGVMLVAEPVEPNQTVIKNLCKEIGKTREVELDVDFLDAKANVNIPLRDSMP